MTDWKAVCNDEVGSYKCQCSPEFQGFNCTEDVNECMDPAFCVNGTCSNFEPTNKQPIGASCKCFAGWLGMFKSLKMTLSEQCYLVLNGLKNNHFFGFNILILITK